VSAVRPHPEGATLAVKARPGAKKNAVLGEENGMVRISVTAPPEDGRANEALIELLRDWLGVKRSQIELLKGQTSREKAFLIRGMTAEALSQQLAQIPQNR
jgi:hypothetical protein